MFPGECSGLVKCHFFEFHNVQVMKSNSPIVIKAYTATGQLIVTKPIHIDNFCALVDVFCDMSLLGVKVYYVKQNEKARKHNLKTKASHRFQVSIPVPRC